MTPRKCRTLTLSSLPAVGSRLAQPTRCRGGDTATGIVGVMTYTWAGNAASGNAYRVRPINALGGSVALQPSNPRPTPRLLYRAGCA